jgi:hypothetical protein
MKTLIQSRPPRRANATPQNFVSSIFAGSSVTESVGNNAMEAYDNVKIGSPKK